jgi:sporulation integral membrane protein YtvI
MFSALFGYIRAQLILMSMTFIELNIGLAIAGVKHSILVAAIISLIDALPILGSGSILIPWSAFSFLMGNFELGVALLVIYVVVLVVRQFVEPKVLGQQIGLHPLITLVAMYSGLKLFGFAGLIIGPVSFLLIKNIASGVLKGKTLKDFFGERRPA